MVSYISKSEKKGEIAMYRLIKNKKHLGDNNFICRMANKDFGLFINLHLKSSSSSQYNVKVNSNTKF